MYKGIIFDFFGVFCTDATREWLIKQPGYESKMEQFARYSDMNDIGDISNQQFFELMAKLFNLSPIEVEDGINSEVVINWNFINYVRTIKDKYHTIILSNAVDEEEMPLIYENNFHDLFDNVLLSGNIGMIKPSLEAFKYALEILGLAADEAIMIDDRKVNIDAAEKCGIKGILFKDTDEVIAELKTLGIS